MCSSADIITGSTTTNMWLLTRMDGHMSGLMSWRGAAASMSQLTNDASTAGFTSTSAHISAQHSPASACSRFTGHQSAQREALRNGMHA